MKRKPPPPSPAIAPRASPKPQFRVEDLEDHVLETFAAPGYRPPELPRVVLEMLALSHQVEVPLERISAVLEQDPMLVSSVIKRARSAFYSRGAPVTNLKSAVVRLGISALRNLVLETALHARVFRSKDFEGPMERLRCHSMAVGHLAKLIAARAKLDVEAAYLGGLLHDVGVAGALLSLTSAHATVRPEVLWPALGHIHERVGSALIQLWGLPDDVQWLAQRHHQEEREKTTDGLLATLRMAEITATGLGATLFDTSPAATGRELHADLDFETHSEASQLQARRTLAFPEADLMAIGAEAARTLPELDPELDKLLKARVAQRKGARPR